MNISFILPGIGDSGGLRVTVSQANELIKRGHSVRLLYKMQPRSYREYFRSLYIKTIRRSPSFISSYKGRLEPYAQLSKCTFKADEIIIGVGVKSCQQLKEIIELPNKMVQFFHEAQPVEQILDAASLPLPKILVASHLQDLIAQRQDAEVLGVINNGIDPNEYYCAFDESERDGVGMIFSFHPAKDPETAISVCKRLERIKPSLPLRLFSTNRKDPRIKGKCFRRFPSINEAREIYSRSKVWVLPSRSEGFPAPVLEAMACGSAVVATDCGGTRDQIVNGENGFLVEVGDVDGIINKVLELLDDEQLRKKVQVKGFETAKYFNWDRAISKLEEVLHRL